MKYTSLLHEWVLREFSGKPRGPSTTVVSPTGLVPFTTEFRGILVTVRSRPV